MLKFHVYRRLRPGALKLTASTELESDARRILETWNEGYIATDNGVIAVKNVPEGVALGNEARQKYTGRS